MRSRPHIKAKTFSSIFIDPGQYLWILFKNQTIVNKHGEKKALAGKILIKIGEKSFETCEELDPDTKPRHFEAEIRINTNFLFKLQARIKSSEDSSPLF